MRRSRTQSRVESDSLDGASATSFWSSAGYLPRWYSHRAVTAWTSASPAAIWDHESSRFPPSIPAPLCRVLRLNTQHTTCRNHQIQNSCIRFLLLVLHIMNLPLTIFSTSTHVRDDDQVSLYTRKHKLGNKSTQYSSRNLLIPRRHPKSPIRRRSNKQLASCLPEKRNHQSFEPQEEEAQY